MDALEKQPVQILESQKIEFLELAISRLEPLVLQALSTDLQRKANKAFLRQNLAMLIDKYQFNDSKNADQEFKDFLDQWIQIFQDPKSTDTPDQKFSRFAYELKLKIMPLYIEYLKKIHAPQNIIEFTEREFEKDRKEFMKTKMAGFTGIGTTHLPEWYVNFAARERRNEMLQRAVEDPETEEFRKNIHAEAIRFLGTSTKQE